jgi:hydrogenase maturation protease
MAATEAHDLPVLKRPPAIVALGDPLRADDAVGLHILSELREFTRSWLGRVEFVDAILPGHSPTERIRARPAMVLLGTLVRGDAPGTVHVMSGQEALRIRHGHPNAAAAGNIVALLRTLQVVDSLPPKVTVIGVEPERLDRAMGLSEPVRAALPAAVRRSIEAVEAMIDVTEATTRPGDATSHAVAS